MKKAVCVFIALISTSLSPSYGDLSSETQILIHELNEAAFLEFYLIKKGDNPLIAPFSIQSSLLMAYMGARGKTASQIANAVSLSLPQKTIRFAYSELYDHLYSDSMEASQYEFKLGNLLWVNDALSILPSYKSLIAKSFKGTLRQIDFSNPTAAVQALNAWITLEASHLSETFLPPNQFTSSTQAFLTNRLIIQGLWKHPFDPRLTTSQSFLTSKNTKKNVNMMHQTHIFPYYEDENSQILSLPLKNQNTHAPLALVIFLPKKILLKNIFDFYYSQQRSNPSAFFDSINKLEDKSVAIYLPRFTFNKSSFFKDFFMSIGLQDIFSKNADFSGMTGDKNFFINNIFDQSFTAVDENGLFTMTAKEIAADLRPFSGNETPTPFNANHPFFYCLVDLDTKLLLFMGVVNDPSKSINMEKKI